MKKDLTQVVLSAQKGDTEAFEELYSQTYNYLYYIISKWVGSDNFDDRFDILQETYIEVFKSIASLKNPNALKTWMSKIAYHQYSKFYNKKPKNIIYEDEQTEGLINEIEDLDEEFLPTEALENKELKKYILTQVDSLPEEQKAIVILFYYNELSISDISETVGCPEGTVKSRLRLSRNRLKSAVDKFMQKGAQAYVLSLPILTQLLQESSNDYILPADKAKSIFLAASKGAGIAIAAKETAKNSSSSNTASSASKGLSNAIKGAIICGCVLGITIIAIIIIVNNNNSKQKKEEAMAHTQLSTPYETSMNISQPTTSALPQLAPSSTHDSDDDNANGFSEESSRPKNNDEPQNKNNQSQNSASNEPGSANSVLRPNIPSNPNLGPNPDSNIGNTASNNNNQNVIYPDSNNLQDSLTQIPNSDNNSQPNAEQTTPSANNEQSQNAEQTPGASIATAPSVSPSEKESDNASSDNHESTIPSATFSDASTATTVLTSTSQSATSNSNSEVVTTTSRSATASQTTSGSSAASSSSSQASTQTTSSTTTTFPTVYESSIVELPTYKKK